MCVCLCERCERVGQCERQAGPDGRATRAQEGGHDNNHTVDQHLQIAPDSSTRGSSTQHHTRQQHTARHTAAAHSTRQHHTRQQHTAPHAAAAPSTRQQHHPAPDSSTTQHQTAPHMAAAPSTTHGSTTLHHTAPSTTRGSSTQHQTASRMGAPWCRPQREPHPAPPATQHHTAGAPSSTQ